jgi:hypothetical protein
VLNVLHTRIRHRSSNLIADLFRVNLINDPGCVCGYLNICACCSSDKLLSPNSKASISKLSRNCRLFVNCSRVESGVKHHNPNYNPNSFRKSLINDVNLLKPSRYYSHGCRVLNVLHTTTDLTQFTDT